MKPLRNRVSVVVIHENKVLGFQAKDPHNKKEYFFLPGGLIGGINITRRYDFEWNGVVYDCTTQFLAGKLLSEKAATVSDAPYHQGVAWAPVPTIESVFGYHKDILEPIELITEQLNRAVE